MPKIELLHEDCMELMAKYPDNHFELAIVDPPYGILNIGMRITKPSRPNSYTAELKHKKKKWDVERPGNDYFFELDRVSKNKIVWGGNYFADMLTASGSWIYWDKINGEGSHFADGELAYTDFTKAIKSFKCSTHNGTRGGKHRIHPTQKPVKLYQWLLKNYAKEGDKILDTHLGSGSSAIAAHYAGHDFVGCELDEDYYKAAMKRFELETSQIDMF